MKKEETSNATFAESILGKSFFEDSLIKKAMSLPSSWRLAGVAGLLAAVLFIPYLGAVGLWDPWEPHYGEVAREMIQRNDFVFPYWENAWFFSKPAMTLWLQALGMKLVGANDPTHLSTSSSSGIFVTLFFVLVLASALTMAFIAWRQKRANAALGAGAVGAVAAMLLVLRLLSMHFLQGAASVNQAPGAMGLYTEWGMRMPFALLSILAVALLALAVGRVVSRRAGLATAFVLCTMPMYFLLTRQAVTDTPFVTALICAMSCAIIGQLDSTTKHRAGWWYGFYVFCGIATLAKGLLGVGLPAVFLLLYACLSVIPWSLESWAKHGRWVTKFAMVPLGAWVGVAAVVGAAGYLVLNQRANTDTSYWHTVHAIVAGLWGFCAGLGAFLYLLHRKVPREGEMPVLWAQLYKMRLGTGVLVFFALQTWYFVMCLFQGVDDESKQYAFRFFVHDHFNRLAEGVHTTTPGGDFIYFIEQGGFAMFPWVLLIPGALALTARLQLRSKDPAEHVGVIAAIWVAFAFTLFSLSETKFHHYLFPVLPGAAILIGMYIDKLWEEGLSRNALILLFGFGLFVLVGRDLASNPKDFTDLFVYNYDRPYPFELVNAPIALFGVRSLWWGDLACAVLLAFGGYLTFDAFRDRTRPIFTRGLGLAMLLVGVALLITLWRRGSVSPSLMVGLALAVAALYLAYEAARDKSEALGLWLACGVLAVIGLGMIGTGVKTSPAQDPMLAHLVTTVNIKEGMGFAFGIAGLLLAVAAMLRSRTMAFGTGWALALGFALWFNWHHWVDLSHQWTQRDLFWDYYRNRQPDEPITAFLMNWRGETFYSRNQVKQIKDNPRLTAYAAQPGRKWALVEHNRLGILKTAAGPDHTVTVQSTPQTNNKFLLVTIE